MTGIPAKTLITMKIQGKIIDKGTGEALPFVNVYFSNREGKINSENKGTTTNEMGRYRFDWPADLWITASMVGYERQTKPLPYDYSDNAVLDFELQQKSSEIVGVEIVAKPINKLRAKIIISSILIAAVIALRYIAVKK